MRNRMSSALWGIVFIIVGLGIIGNIIGIWNFQVFFPGWWTLFIIVPSAASVIRVGAKTVPVSAFIVGVLLLLACQGWFEYETIEKLIVPIILIVIGGNMIFKNFRTKEEKKIADLQMGEQRDYSAFFAGQGVTYNENEIFDGCTMNAVFGSVTLDLRSCIINHDTSIDCSAIFGGIDIFVPSDVNIKISSTPIFGGVGNKIRNRAYIQGAPIVYINALCMFGGVDIK